MKYFHALELLAAVTLCCTSALAQPAGGVDTLSQYILTPKAGDSPRINGARVFGVRPGSQFLFSIAATGVRPMSFGAENLPKGLKLDAHTGQITGRIKKAGEYVVTLKATNSKGTAERDLRIVVGDRIALTPPLGWNSWNCWGHDISEEKVRAAARAMKEKGLADHGWQYINIDDGWQLKRGGKYKGVMPNSKFPDMKGLVEEIHALGLKAGIYSGPWVGTYAGHVGSYADTEDGTYAWLDTIANEYGRFVDRNGVKHGQNYHHGKYSFVKNDVQQWADWGMDYLKYDWNPNDWYHVHEMWEALRSTDRDIVYSLSNSAPWADAPMYVAMANTWRTTGDIRDTWERMRDLGFNQSKWTAFVGPGHWVDPDMLVVGQVGWGPKLHQTRLTADEQYTHISLWSLLAAPLLIGCDMSRLDDFTLSLLTNDEVIDIDQDPLGIPATLIKQDEDIRVYAKQLEDGSMAVGLFNLSSQERTISVTWKNLGMRGEQTIRDVWRQQDIGKSATEYKASVRPHGVSLVKIYPGNSRERATSGR